MSRALPRAVAVIVCLLALQSAAAPGTAQAQTLRAGVGKADVTPQLGYYLGGWTRADRTAGGQHTRLFSRALVLQRGDRKIALVSVDLFMISAGMVRHIGERLAARGFSERNILISASHTHSGPGGYANFPTLNTSAPSLQTATDPATFAGFLSPEAADPQLYAFLLGRISTAIERADADLAPAAAGWGSERILGLTRNRSLEAHLANHGVIRARGDGREEEDPAGGYEHTIDPDVNVLRVDKLRTRRVRCRRRGRLTRCRRTVRIPIGAWSTFADHGTVTKSSFEFYNADHHASAMRVFEDRVRREGRVPRGQEVLNVYGNSNEGDMSAGLDRHGPAASDYVGRTEAAAMHWAWRQAGGRLSRTPQLDLRWTTACFCGQMVENGERVADESQVGAPFLTGSEEERGPLFDVTGQTFEDRRAVVPMGPHGVKLFAPGVGAGGVPNVVPLLAIRIGPRLIVSVPGEGTKEVGARIRQAVGSSVAGSGIEGVVVSGLANEFVLYFTTPEEYDRQHYEGGNTHFGRQSSNVIKNALAQLAGTLVRGEPAPEPMPFDSTNGVVPEGPPYGDGAASGAILRQPSSSYERLERAQLSWRGGPLGLDRPVDRAFVIAERRDARGRWVQADSDLGLAMLWSVDDAGVHEARWEIPRDAPADTYRLIVQAKRYRLESREFDVVPSRELTVRQVVGGDEGRIGVALFYPVAQRDVDLTYRPERASGGTVRFEVDRRTITVDLRRGEVFPLSASPGASVEVPAGAAADRWGNTNGRAVRLR